MLNDVIEAPRTDSVYNMHGYLTKVPVSAIIPFLNEYTIENELVVDLFAGSGMTAVACKMSNRNAEVSDISILGKHIGDGYLTQVKHEDFVKTSEQIVYDSKQTVGYFYMSKRLSDNIDIEVIRTIWTHIYSCVNCNNEINYYECLKTAKWSKTNMFCPKCNSKFEKRSSIYIREEPVHIVIHDEKGKQIDQDITTPDIKNIKDAEKSNIMDTVPNIVIDSSREMYKKSALKKWRLTETKFFFSHRNLIILHDLWCRINNIENSHLKKKLLFCFTAILPRASKRYQWSYKAPLNAANQTYYIAPVFYEWNVYELFQRKIRAALKADEYIQNSLERDTKQIYRTASAHNLQHLKNGSVDYIFTDPPFGSNIYYADMNLFQEAWLQQYTLHENEAVIKTNGDKKASEQNYKNLLTGAFREAYRILKPGKYISIVFGNSKGTIWNMALQAIRDAGFQSKPTRISILDKGQRSVKGLSSGFENVVTLDLIITFQKPNEEVFEACKRNLSETNIVCESIEGISLSNDMSASHIYLEVLRNAIANDINFENIHLSDIQNYLDNIGVKINSQTGKLIID